MVLVVYAGDVVVLELCQRPVVDDMTVNVLDRAVLLQRTPPSGIRMNESLHGCEYGGLGRLSMVPTLFTTMPPKLCATKMIGRSMD